MDDDVLREVLTAPTMRAVNEACADLGIAPDRIVSVLYVVPEVDGAPAKFRVIYRADPFRPDDLRQR
jgi:hypothetical protein